MQIVDDLSRARGFQAMVAMRDSTRLNTFVFLPGSGGPRWPVILHRTPDGITAAGASDKTDFTRHGCRARRNRCAAQSCAGGAIS
jgi:predicted acyl esterase